MNSYIELFDLDQIKKSILEHNIFSLIDPNNTIRVLSGIQRNGIFQDDTIQYKYCIFEPVCYILNSLGYKKYNKLMIKDKLDLDFYREYIDDVKNTFVLMDKNSMEWDEIKKGKIKCWVNNKNNFVKDIIRINEISDFEQLYLFLIDKQNKEKIKKEAEKNMITLFDVMKLIIYVSKRQRIFNIKKEFTRQVEIYMDKKIVREVCCDEN